MPIAHPLFLNFYQLKMSQDTAKWSWRGWGKVVPSWALLMEKEEHKDRSARLLECDTFLPNPPRVLWEVAKDTLYQRFKKFFSDGSFGHLGELCSDFCAGWKWEREVRTPPIVSLNSVRMMGVLEHQRSSGGTLFTEKVIMFVIVISKPKGIIIMVWFTEIFAFVH